MTKIATVGQRNLSREGEAESQAIWAAGNERLEETVENFRCNAGACVADGHDQRRLLAIRAHLNLNRPSARCVIQRVVDQVVE